MVLKELKDFWKEFWKANGYLYCAGAFIGLVVYTFSFFSPIFSAFFVSVSGGIFGGIVAAILIKESRKEKIKKAKKVEKKTKKIKLENSFSGIYTLIGLTFIAGVLFMFIPIYFQDIFEFVSLGIEGERGMLFSAGTLLVAISFSMFILVLQDEKLSIDLKLLHKGQKANEKLLKKILKEKK